MPHSPVIFRHILPLALKMLYASLRISITPTQGVLPGQGTLFAFWHGKMIAGWLVAQALFPEKKINAVVSMSKDGSILADALEQCGFTLIRGSSSKGGGEVKHAMLNTLRNNGIVVLTPDGPRGPVKQFKYGTLRLASSHHVPLVFAEISYASRWKLQSWDSFEIPKPFSKTAIHLHLIELPDFRSEQELQAYATTLSERFSHA